MEAWLMMQTDKLLQSKAVKLIKVDPNNSLEQNAKNLSNKTTCVLRHVFLKANEKAFLTILPLNELIDFKKINAISGHHTNIISHHESGYYHTTKTNTQKLPLKPINTDKIFIAITIKSYEFIIFESGNPSILIKTTPKELITFIEHGQYLSFTKEASTIELTPGPLDTQSKFTPNNEKRLQLERLYKLPAMPQMANELIVLKNNDKAHVNDLAALIQKDPSLSAQIIRHSKSAFFNYQGEINSVNDAISRVLGFNSVINIALGLSLGKKLRNPPDGPLGLNEYWKHAVFSATLAQVLSKYLPKETKTKPDLAYLCGLLHNIGFLLLGHLFQPEFFLLNRLYAANLTRSIVWIEKHALGMGVGQNAINMGHAELGAWLLEKWKLPNEAITVAREHHSFDYSGKHTNYSLLITLVNNAFGLHGIGDHREETLNEILCSKLGIKPSVVHHEVKALIQASSEIEMTIRQFAA